MSSGEIVRKAECGCCGIWEECTIGYILWVQERFGGVWVCGLCEEAIKDEQARFGVGVDAALRLHATFREAAAADPAIQIAKCLLRFVKKLMPASSSSS